jgi:hypothetical protein
MGEIIMIHHDDSAVTGLEDFYARKRELEALAITRAAVLHAAWRPMLAGAVGAALIIGAVWVALPKVSYREIEVPKVSYRDVTVDHLVPHDVTVNNLIAHDVDRDSADRGVPFASAPLAGGESFHRHGRLEGRRHPRADSQT